MDIKGLNEEQLNYIIEQAKNGKHPMTIENEDDLFGYLEEADTVTEQDHSGHRWWTTFTQIVKIGERFFGFENASTTGDDSPVDKGWERYENEVIEYIAIKEGCTVYKQKG